MLRLGMEEFDNCEDLRLVKRLGRGNLSSVFLAVHRNTKNVCAVKVMNKEILQKKKASKMAATEKDILSSLDHPFLPSLLTHFESENHTFLAMKYCCGGDINVLRHNQPNKTFSDSTIRFYAAEVVVALEYLHKQGIVYRDLKPENILVQESGHIMLTDFDLSLRLCLSEDGGQSNSFVGTVEYIAPEVLWGKPHAFAMDWWSFGVFLYEMSHGKTPFRGSNRKDTFVNILCKEPFFANGSSSTPLNDLIRRLLSKEPSKRLGLKQVKNHQFFRGLRWDQLEFVSRPPFVPPPQYHQDDEYENTTEDVDLAVSNSVLRSSDSYEGEYGRCRGSGITDSEMAKAINNCAIQSL